VHTATNISKYLFAIWVQWYMLIIPTTCEFKVRVLNVQSQTEQHNQTLFQKKDENKEIKYFCLCEWYLMRRTPPKEVAHKTFFL
jgi:hypothetical protein